MTWNNHKPHKHVTTTLRQKTLKKDHYTCQNCGWQDHTAKTLHTDHIKNLATGGTNNPNNLQTLCTWCHNHKTQQEATQGKNSWKRPKPRHPGLR